MSAENATVTGIESLSMGTAGKESVCFHGQRESKFVSEWRLQVIENLFCPVSVAKLREAPEISTKIPRYIYECKLLRVFCPALILSVDSTGAG